MRAEFYFVTFLFADKIDTKKFTNYDSMREFCLFIKYYKGKILRIKDECGNPLLNDDLT